MRYGDDEPQTANQYLRFGWRLINHYVVDATADQPKMMKYVLASVSRLEDTREVAVVSDPAEVNEYLTLGWKLIDKRVAATPSSKGATKRCTSSSHGKRMTRRYGPGKVLRS